MDELSLITEAKKGDQRALAMLLQKHYAFVKNYLLKLTLSPSLAEDLTQETVLRCIRKLHLYQDKSKFSSWMITIAGRLYIDYTRKQKREKRWLEGEQARRHIRFQAERSGHSWPELLEALGGLSPDMRMAVVMKHYYGYTIEEIADIVGVPEGTVKSRIHHAVRRLREELTLDEEI